MGTPVFLSGNLLTELPDAADAEHFETLVETPEVRIERIVSRGQRTPAETWLDQDWDEWVLLLQGAAELLLEEWTNHIDCGAATTCSFPHARDTV